MSPPLIYASFWGRLWRNEAAHAARATAIDRSLTDHPARLGGGTFMQSSFYLDEGWYDGARASELSTPFITRTIQLLIDRGVIPEANGARDDGSQALLIVFLDEALSLAPGADAPSATFHGHFKTRLGNACIYGVVADTVDDGEGRDRRLAAAAWAVVAAMRANPAPEGGWAAIDAARTDRGESGADSPADADDAPHPSDRMLPLPSIHAAERAPRFQIDPQEMERYVARLGLPDILGSAMVLKQATALIEARVAERGTRPSPASETELREFERPNPRVTMPERLAALKFTLGEGHPDAALVEQIVAGVSEPAFAKMRRVYFNDGAFNFIDTVYWIYHKLRLARTLGLDSGAPRSILDIGCGGGHFSRVCEHFGHRVLGTDIEQPVYGAIAAALKVERTINVLMADTPTIDFGRKFDLVTAVQVEFNRLYPRTGPPRYWTIDHWKFLFNDLMERQLIFPARIYIYLNFEIHDGKGSYNADLLKLCANHGADVNARRGIIDWKLDGPVRVA